MIILKQNSELQETWQKQINQKKQDQRQRTKDNFGGGLLGEIGATFWQVKQWKNELKGSMGEGFVALLLSSLPDTWVMFNNALIPDYRGKLTEIDHLIIGSGGVFLIEVKTWSGSFLANRDNWKRRQGQTWQTLENSPSSQSAYHQKQFQQWLNRQIPNLNPDVVSAPVVFTVAQWLKAQNCSVPILDGIEPLLRLLHSSPKRLTPELVLEISSLVKDYSPSASVSNSKLSSQPKPKPKLRSTPKI